MRTLRLLSSSLPALPALVVTGVGAVTPLGGCVATTLAALARGDSAPRAATASDLGADWAHRTDLLAPGRLPLVAAVTEAALAARPPCFAPPATVGAARGAARFAVLADAAAGEAVGDAGLGGDDGHRQGVAIGCALGGFGELAAAGVAAAAPPTSATGLRRLGPFFVPRVLPNMAAGHVSIGRGLRGPLAAPAAGGAAGVAALASAARSLEAGAADAILAGGAEAAISAPALVALGSDGALAGGALGEGAALLVVERADAAASRGARPLARLLSTATAFGDAGDAAVAAAAAALARAGAPAVAVVAAPAAAHAALAALLPHALFLDTRPVLGDALAASGAMDAALVVAALAGRLPQPAGPASFPLHALRDATRATAALVVAPCGVGGGAAAAVFGGGGD